MGQRYTTTFAGPRSAGHQATLSLSRCREVAVRLGTESHPGFSGDPCNTRPRRTGRLSRVRHGAWRLVDLPPGGKAAARACDDGSSGKVERHAAPLLEFAAGTGQSAFG